MGAQIVTVKINPALWQARQEAGYTTEIEGVRYMLDLDAANGATVLEPVEVVDRWPRAGDAVRLKREWWFVKPGAIAIIDGMVGEDLKEDSRPVFGCRGQAFRGPAGGTPGAEEYVSCSGGPAPISLPVRYLRPTDETIRFTFWKWRSTPQAHGGVEYELEVPVWDWFGEGGRGVEEKLEPEKFGMPKA
jgi:hypothetical protein